VLFETADDGEIDLVDISPVFLCRHTRNLHDS